MDFFRKNFATGQAGPVVGSEQARTIQCTKWVENPATGTSWGTARNKAPEHTQATHTNVAILLVKMRGFGPSHCRSPVGKVPS